MRQSTIEVFFNASGVVAGANEVGGHGDGNGSELSPSEEMHQTMAMSRILAYFWCNRL